MKTLIGAIILLAITAFGTAYAQPLPESYPDRFQRSGKVEDVQAATIVIGDIAFALANSVVVHSTTSTRASVRSLRPGMTVGFRLGQNREVVEIWLLPSNYDPARNRR